MKRTVHTIAGFAALLAAAAVMSPGSVGAQEGLFFKRLLGDLGVIDDPDKEAIVYRERAPLVVPPGLDLPPPQAPVASRTASWPTDPDVVKRRRIADEARAPAPMPSAANTAEGAVLRGPEMKKLRATSTAGPREHYGESRLTNWVDPTELRRTREDKTQKVVHGQEPERGSLIEPPSGYRLPAANASIAKTRDAPTLNPVNDPNPERTAGKERQDD